MGKRSPSPTTDELRDFLSRLAARPFRYGETDCCLALADWWRERRGVDPAAHLRGTYHDEASCEELVARAGGLIALVGTVARCVGAVETTAPEPGDCAVIAYRGRKYGAIMTPSRRWAAKLNFARGLCALRSCDVARSWEI